MMTAQLRTFGPPEPRAYVNLSGNRERRKRPRCGTCWIHQDNWAVDDELILTCGLRHDSDGGFTAEVEVTGIIRTTDGRTLEYHKWVKVPCTEVAEGGAA